MRKSLKIVKIRPEQNKTLIDLLLELLADAKSGELQTLAFVGETRDNGITTGATEKRDRLRVIGALARLQYRLLQESDR